MSLTRLATLSLCVLGAALAAGPARADWTQFGGSLEHGLYANDKLQAPLTLSWKYPTAYAKAGNRGGPVIEAGTVYFPSGQTLYAVDAATGETRWHVPEADVSDANVPTMTCTPTVRGDMVYIGDISGSMTAYATADGNKVWEFKTGGAVRSSPVLIGDQLVFGSDDDYVYSLNARSGDLIWKSNEGLKGKDTPLTANVIGAPVYYGGVVYVSSADMKVYALTADTGRILWQQRMTAPTGEMSPVAMGGRIYMASGSTIYQFRLRGGNFRPFTLTQYMDGDIAVTPIITDKYWYVGDRNGNFYAFTTAGKPAATPTGEPWKVKVEGRPAGTPVLAGDTLYVTTERGFVYGIDAVKGKVTWTYRSEPPKGITPLYSYYAMRAPLAVSDNRLYTLGDDGTLSCMSATAPDDEGPTLLGPKPTRGTVMNGSPPIKISAYLWDEGSGVNPDTIEVFLNGQPIDRDKEPYNEHVGTKQRDGWVYDPLKRLVWFETKRAEKGEKESPLPDGPTRVQIQAADWHGNFSTIEWTFVIDNTLPRNAVVVKPKKGTTPGAAGAQGQGQNGQPVFGRGNNGNSRNRFGGYTYNNRNGNNQNGGGRGGQGFGSGSGFGGSGGQGGGFGGRGGGGGGGRYGR